VDPIKPTLEITSCQIKIFSWQIVILELAKLGFLPTQSSWLRYGPEFMQNAVWKEVYSFMSFLFKFYDLQTIFSRTKIFELQISVKLKSLFCL